MLSSLSDGDECFRTSMAPKGRHGSRFYRRGLAGAWGVDCTESYKSAFKHHCLEGRYTSHMLIRSGRYLK